MGNGCSGNEVGSCGGQRDQYDTEYLLGQAFVSKVTATATASEGRGRRACVAYKSFFNCDGRQ